MSHEARQSGADHVRHQSSAPPIKGNRRLAASIAAERLVSPADAAVPRASAVVCCVCTPPRTAQSIAAPPDRPPSTARRQGAGQGNARRRRQATPAAAAAHRLLAARHHGLWQPTQRPQALPPTADRVDSGICLTAPAVCQRRQPELCAAPHAAHVGQQQRAAAQQHVHLLVAAPDRPCGWRRVAAAGGWRRGLPHGHAALPTAARRRPPTAQAAAQRRVAGLRALAR